MWPNSHLPIGPSYGCCLQTIWVTGQSPPGHVPPRHLPQGHIPPVTYPLDTYPPGHLYIPLGQITSRTYTPQTLKCPFWFIYHVSITYCTLKSIYFAGITFICDAGAMKLSDICPVRKGLNPHKFSGFKWSGGRCCAHVRCQF